MVERFKTREYLAYKRKLVDVFLISGAVFLTIDYAGQLVLLLTLDTRILYDKFMHPLIRVLN